MSDYIYRSELGSLIENFVKLKQASGYPYNSSARILHCFDAFAEKNHAQTLTREICNGWIQLRPGEHPNGLLRRITPIRQFGKYLLGLGHEAYVIPGHIPNKQIKYQAHIYTMQELKAFFSSVDQCPPSVFSPTRCYVIPVIFRLIYCCGLRSSEARLLRRDDVDLQTGKITIRESKGWKARIIYMDRDMLRVCGEYQSIMASMFPLAKAFFPNKDGDFFSTSVIDYWFHEFWDTLPEASSVQGNPARVHDFRHAYAVHRLNQWVREGQDINALYAYLSAYMGHSNFTDTDYYLSLVEEFYPQMDELLTSVNIDILPEVCHEEER